MTKEEREAKEDMEESSEGSFVLGRCSLPIKVDSWR